MIKRSFVFLAVLGFSIVSHAKPQEELQGKLVVNSKATSVLRTTTGKHEIAGRVSAYFRITETGFREGNIQVGGFNLAYFDVLQEAVTGRPSNGKETGVLGFSIDAGKELQTIKYNPNDNTLSGRIRGQISLSQFDEFFVPDAGKGEHDFDGLTQTAYLNVKMKLEKPLDPDIGRDSIAELSGELEFDLDAQALPNYKIADYSIASGLTRVDLEISWIYFFEVARRLCIQPVRIGRFIWTGSWPWQLIISYSGDGLAFGMPGANTEWAKADVVFQVRDWKTVWNSQYSTLSSSEASSLRAEVSDDDCVEVFFVDQLSPNDMWGGGATWSGGSSSAKVISSDENADFGIDQTHLAHELGHVMTLKHPGQGFPNASAPHRIDGSSGTLMCPSGFQNDNPQVNSQWNKDSIQNPLFMFSLKLVSAGPDCNHDPDCGACP